MDRGGWLGLQSQGHKDADKTEATQHAHKKTLLVFIYENNNDKNEKLFTMIYKKDVKQDGHLNNLYSSIKSITKLIDYFR